MSLETFEGALDRIELLERTKEKYRTILVQVGMALTTGIWLAYLLYVMIGWVNRPETLPSFEQVKGLLWKSFAVWGIVTVGLYPVFSKIGGMLGEREIEKRIEERRRRLIQERVFLEMLRVEKGAEVRAEGGILILEGFTPAGETIMEKVADLKSTLDQFFTQMKILKKEVVSVNVRASDPELGSAFERFLRRYFGAAKPQIMVSLLPKDEGPEAVKIDMIVA